MECLGRISLDIPLRAFIKTLWSNLSQQGKEDVQSKQAIFKMLLTTGCDFYELLSLYAEFPLTEKDGEALIEYAPPPASIFTITQANVRVALPHWTPSRYHTAPITEVVQGIYQQLFLGKPLVKVYNSNLNPRNRKAYNDRYILLITTHKSLLIDIKRRTTIQFRQAP